MARVSIVTLGCPKNAVDSEALGGLLQRDGHDVHARPENADVILVNTCGFIDPARKETVDEVLELAELKEDGSARGLVLTGCLVARSSAELAETLPEVDALVDFDAYPQIGDIVARLDAGESVERVYGTPGTRFDPAWWDAGVAGGPKVRFGRAPWSYLKIAEGCDRGCTFCAIPLMRGKFRSRSADVIEAEARGLVEQGVTELSLVSQDSVMWGRDTGEGDLLALLSRLERIDGLRRIRLMYLHPQGVSDELIDRILGSERVVNYFDLSLQHVSPTVLRGMGRWGGRARFERLIDRIRTGDPDAGVRTTYILGFPGETDADAEEVADFVGSSDADWIGTFVYSREEGTRSNLMAGHVPNEVARERAGIVAAVADAAMERRAASMVGRRLEVLVERFDLEERTWTGRSQREAPEIDGNISFSCDDEVRVGDYVTVLVESSHGTDLVGRVER